MQKAVFQQYFRLNFTQCYANSFLKYNELSHLLQLTAAAHAEQHGYGAIDMMQQQQAWVLSRIRIEIAKLPKFLQEICIHTWIEEFQGNRLTRNFEIYCANKKIVTATSIWVVLDLKTRRPGQLYKPVAAELILHDKQATSLPCQRIDKTQEYEAEDKYKVKLSDLDMVNHVNNAKYSDWCLDSLPMDLVLQSPFQSIDMNYLKELHISQEVSIQHSTTDAQFAFSIKKDDQAVFLLQIER